jgi:hypothetical protein
MWKVNHLPVEQLFLQVNAFRVTAQLFVLQCFKCSAHLVGITSTCKAITISCLSLRITCDEVLPNSFRKFSMNLFSYYENIQHGRGSRVSAVGIATGCGLDDREVEVQVPVGSRIFTTPYRPDQLWGPPNLLYSGYWG